MGHVGTTKGLLTIGMVHFYYAYPVQPWPACNGIVRITTNPFLTAEYYDWLT